MDGLILRAYIDKQKKPKLHIARELGMSKQNLYQLFDSSNFTDETIKNIESVFKTKWGAIKASVNIDNNIATEKRETAIGQEMAPTSQLLETIQLLVRQNDKLADTNKILAEKITTIPVNDLSETQRSVDAMLQGLREFALKIAVGKRFQSLEEARSAYRKELGDVLGKMKAKDIQNS